MRLDVVKFCWMPKRGAVQYQKILTLRAAMADSENRPQTALGD